MATSTNKTFGLGEVGEVTPAKDVAFPLDSVALENEYLGIARSLGGDGVSHMAGDEYLASTKALYHGGPVSWAFVPKIFSKRDVSYLAWIAQTMGTIMEKLTRRYLEDPELRARFGIQPELERLALLPVPYRQIFPIARVDIFLNEQTGDFKFCELNTDGSSGMTTTEEVTRANALTETGKEFARRHALSAFDVNEACVKAVVDTYRTIPDARKRPAFAAVDFKESVALDEIEDLAAVFRKNGATLRFTDVRDLSYDGEYLRDQEGPIHAVWRRLVASEMLEKPCDGVNALIEAAQDGAVPVIGSWRTWPVATKTVFAILRDRIARKFLSTEEIEFVEKHVPQTFLLGPGSDLVSFSNRAQWILKPRDGYNSVGVVAGADCTDADWHRALVKARETGGIVQEYAPQYKTSNAPGGIEGVGAEWSPYSNMEGLYLFNGKFGGVFTRCGASAVIGEFAGRLNMGCIVVDDEEE